MKYYVRPEYFLCLKTSSRLRLETAATEWQLQLWRMRFQSIHQIDETRYFILFSLNSLNFFEFLWISLNSSEFRRIDWIQIWVSYVNEKLSLPGTEWRQFDVRKGMVTGLLPYLTFANNTVYRGNSTVKGLSGFGPSMPFPMASYYLELLCELHLYSTGHLQILRYISKWKILVTFRPVGFT